MYKVCVDGAEVEIKPEISTVNHSKKSDTVDSISQNLFTIDGNLILLEEDLEAWAKKFKCSYDQSAFKKGMLEFDSIKVSNLSKNCFISGLKVVTTDTIVTLLLKVSSPAINPSSSLPDVNPLYVFKVTIKNCKQSVLSTT